MMAELEDILNDLDAELNDAELAVTNARGTLCEALRLAQIQSEEIANLEEEVENLQERIKELEEELDGGEE